MERAPTAPTSQPPAPAVTTPLRGRPKPPEPKRSQASAPPDADVDMAPPPSPPRQAEQQGTGRALFPVEHQSQQVAHPPASTVSPPNQGLSMVGFLC
eukprot:scaffold195916_cov34-Tisochrysis_lutea.AAC.5